MATVVVEMKTCEKTHKIIVSVREDGDFDVSIESDCPKIVDYGARLNKITLTDIVDLNGSHILDPKIRADISSNCLSILGVINAGWLEAGLMTKTLAKNANSNVIRFVDAEGEILR